MCTVCTSPHNVDLQCVLYSILVRWYCSRCRVFCILYFVFCSSLHNGCLQCVPCARSHCNSELYSAFYRNTLRCANRVQLCLTALKNDKMMNIEESKSHSFIVLDENFLWSWVSRFNRCWHLAFGITLNCDIPTETYNVHSLPSLQKFVKF